MPPLIKNGRSSGSGCSLNDYKVSARVFLLMLLQASVLPSVVAVALALARWMAAFAISRVLAQIMLPLRLQL